MIESEWKSKYLSHLISLGCPEVLAMVATNFVVVDFRTKPEDAAEYEFELMQEDN